MRQLFIDRSLVEAINSSLFPFKRFWSLSFINYYGIDLMFFSLHLVGLSSLLGSINFIVSLLKACNLSILSACRSQPGRHGGHDPYKEQVRQKRR